MISWSNISLNTQPLLKCRTSFFCLVSASKPNMMLKSSVTAVAKYRGSPFCFKRLFALRACLLIHSPPHFPPCGAQQLPPELWFSWPARRHIMTQKDFYQTSTCWDWQQNASALLLLPDPQLMQNIHGMVDTTLSWELYRRRNCFLARDKPPKQLQQLQKKKDNTKKPQILKTPKLILLKWFYSAVTSENFISQSINRTSNYNLLCTAQIINRI